MPTVAAPAAVARLNNDQRDAAVDERRELAARIGIADIGETLAERRHRSSTLAQVRAVDDDSGHRRQDSSA
jgi:hypothetical protein